MTNWENMTSTDEQKIIDNIDKVATSPIVRPRCQWWQDEDGVWDTACDNRHEFIEDGPKENHYHFCPYCGKPLEVYVAPSEPTVGNESI